MEKSYREILNNQEVPYGYLEEIQELMETGNDILMAATMVFDFGRIIGIRQERAKRKAARV